MKTISEGSRVWWIYRRHGSSSALTAPAEVVALHSARNCSLAWIRVFMPLTGIEFRRVSQTGLRIRTTIVPALDDHV
jgi:hypothetical protein